MDHSDPDHGDGADGEQPEKLTAAQRHGARYGSTSTSSTDATEDESRTKSRDGEPIA